MIKGVLSGLRRLLGAGTAGHQSVQPRTGSEGTLTIPSVDELFSLYAVDCRNDLVACSLYRIAQAAASCGASETIDTCMESMKRFGEERLRFLFLLEQARNGRGVAA